MLGLNKLSRKTREGIFLFLLALPFIIMVFIFTYFPLYGWRYAFYDHRLPLRLEQTEFVGFHWFRMLIDNPVQLRQIRDVLRNTFAISGLGILTSWFPIAFAILLTEVRLAKFKKSVQILTTLPHYISWVLVFSMAFAIFANDGMLNNLLLQLGLIERPIAFLMSSNRVWVTMTAWGVWKGLGWGAIIYLAAISGIDQEQYEAARVDGAGRLALIRHITIPGVLPTYTVLLLLAVANMLNNGFDQFFVFSNAFNMHRIQVLDLYVYNIGIAGTLSSMATAISMLRSIVSIILLFTVNQIAKMLRGEAII
ncbi:MAG: ABC transporter permease subunit [Defluviitaleaceae bacterium]|nr:ABC transporter permease subunit [Defluviitaleaceae bacterium]